MIIFGLTLASGLLGCRSTGPWIALESSGPWIRPGERLRTETREFRWTFPASGYEYRWTDFRGHGYDRYEFVDSAERYLKGLEITREWRDVQIDYGKQGLKTLKNAPYDFTIVSVQPIIVIMQPRDRPEIKSRYERAEDPALNELSGSHLTNLFAHKTEMPFSTEFLWFSPDLGQSPVRLSVGTGDVLIPLPEGRLRLVRSRNLLMVIRE